MKLFHRLAAVVFTAILATSLASCGNDEPSTPTPDSEPRTYLSINGRTFPIALTQLSGSFNAALSQVTFSVTVDNVDASDIYFFEYTDNAKPSEDLVISSKGLTMRPMVSSTISSPALCTYQSGTATITAVDPKAHTITITFSKLKLANKSQSYTFDGEATVGFN